MIASRPVRDRPTPFYNSRLPEKVANPVGTASRPPPSGPAAAGSSSPAGSADRGFLGFGSRIRRQPDLGYDPRNHETHQASENDFDHAPDIRCNICWRPLLDAGGDDDRGGDWGYSPAELRTNKVRRRQCRPE